MALEASQNSAPRELAEMLGKWLVISAYSPLLSLPLGGAIAGTLSDAPDFIWSAQQHRNIWHPDMVADVESGMLMGIPVGIALSALITIVAQLLENQRPR